MPVAVKRWLAPLGAAARRAGSLVPPRLQRWPHWRHFRTNLVIGLLIEIAIHAMTGGSLVTTLRNAVQDATMSVASLRSGTAHPSQPITIFDVDDETWRDPLWEGGETDVAPRAPVAKLIDLALREGAENVVVDIVIEGAGKAQDLPFVTAMAALQQRMRPGQTVLFARSVRNPICAQENCEGLQQGPTLRSSALDPLVAASGGKLVLVSPSFRISPDGVLREWSLWKPVCVPDATGSAGTWQVLPSVQLALGQRQPAWSKPSGFGRCLPTRPDDAPAFSDGTGFVSERQAIAAIDMAMASNPVSGAGSGHSAARPSAHYDPTSTIFFRYSSGTGPAASGGNNIQTLSARTLLDGRETGSLAGQTVIIAQSHEAARDHHLTPLGRLSGAMVLANSINSLRDPGVIKPARALAELLFAVVMIVLAAWLFAVVHAAFSVVLACAFVPFLLLVSYVSMSNGIKLGSEIALLGIYLHWLIQTIEKALASGSHHASKSEEPQQ